MPASSRVHKNPIGDRNRQEIGRIGIPVVRLISVSFDLKSSTGALLRGNSAQPI
jgi:hypothetical protein